VRTRPGCTITGGNRITSVLGGVTTDDIGRHLTQLIQRLHHAGRRRTRGRTGNVACFDPRPDSRVPPAV